MLIALKEIYSFRSDWHHLHFHTRVRPSNLNYSPQIKVNEEKPAPPEDEVFLSLRLWLGNTGPLGPQFLKELFLLALLPRNLFQFPDCCAAGGLGAIISRFLSSNLRSVRLQGKRGPLNMGWTPVDVPPAPRAS